MIKSVSGELKFWKDLRCDPELPAVDIPFVDEHINLYVLKNNALRREIASRPMTQAIREKIGNYNRRFRWKSGLGVTIICCGVICGGYWILCCDGGTLMITTAGAVGGYLTTTSVIDNQHETTRTDAIIDHLHHHNRKMLDVGTVAVFGHNAGTVNMDKDTEQHPNAADSDNGIDTNSMGKTSESGGKSQVNIQGDITGGLHVGPQGVTHGKHPAVVNVGGKVTGPIHVGSTEVTHTNPTGEAQGGMTITHTNGIVHVAGVNNGNVDIKPENPQVKPQVTSQGTSQGTFPSAAGLAQFNEYLGHEIVETLNNDNSLVNALCASKFDGKGQIPMLCSTEETDQITHFMAKYPNLKINGVYGEQQHYKRVEHVYYWAMSTGINVMIYEPKYVDGKLDRVIKRVIIGEKDQTDFIVLTLQKNEKGPHWNWFKALRTEDIKVMTERSEGLTDKPNQCRIGGEGARATKIVDREPQRMTNDEENEKWTALHYVIAAIVIMGILWCCGGAVLGIVLFVHAVMRWFNRSSSPEIEIEEEKESEPSVADMV